MKENNLLHVKLEYDECIESKKEILSLQINALKILKIMERFNGLRMDELEMKERLHEKIKETDKNIGKLQTILPHVKLPQEERQIRRKTTTPRHKDDSLERELNDIQEKLKAIGG